MKRTPLKRGKPLKRTGRLSHRSKKREEEAAERAIVRAHAYARDGWRCRMAGMGEFFPADVGPCRGPLDAHEVIPRSAWRAGYLVLDNVVSVCRAHHDWIGEHPALAHDLGLHGYSWERPVTPPSHNGRTNPTQEGP